MTGHRQRDANRRNAARSTGPRTAVGKAVARMNARRHGLAAPLGSEPGMDQEIERLAGAIAGARPDLMDLARRIAEADLELRRIRKARLVLAKNPPQAPSNPILDIIDELVEEGGLKPPPFRLRWERLRLRQLHREEIAIERYERRALSRRKFAIRDFDTARLATDLGSTE